MCEFSFALLITAPDGVPFATPLPFTILEDTHRLLTHVSKANPQWQHLQPDREVLIVFQGDHAFISPRWYESSPQVPTWNYATVHAYATPRIMDFVATRAQLEALMNAHDHAGDMAALPEEYLAKMQNGIVGIELRVTRLEGKLKLSQNKSIRDQQNVVAELEAAGPLERGVAQRMRTNLE